MASQNSSRPAPPIGGVGPLGLGEPLAYSNYTNVSHPFLRGYEPGDTLVAGWTGTICADTLDVHQLAERLFERHNRDDRPDGQICPSMSVGDVVVIGEVALTVKSIGFGICTVHPDDVVSDMTWTQYVERHPFVR